MKSWSPFEKVLLAVYAVALGYALAGGRGVPDTLLIFLAAANVHVVIARHWGEKLARRWALTVLAAVTLAVGIGARTGQPFGTFYFSACLGPIVPGGVPLAVPFLWMAVISGCLMTVRAFLPWASARGEAALVATAVVAFDFLAEPYFAWTKGAWFWGANRVPFQNYLSWWVISYLLVRLVAPTSGLRWEREWRPAAIVGGLVLLTLSRAT